MLPLLRHRSNHQPCWSLLSATAPHPVMASWSTTSPYRPYRHRAYQASYSPNPRGYRLCKKDWKKAVHQDDILSQHVLTFERSSNVLRNLRKNKFHKSHSLAEQVHRSCRGSALAWQRDVAMSLLSEGWWRSIRVRRGAMRKVRSTWFSVVIRRPLDFHRLLGDTGGFEGVRNCWDTRRQRM